MRKRYSSCQYLVEGKQIFQRASLPFPFCSVLVYIIFKALSCHLRSSGAHRGLDLLFYSLFHQWASKMALENSTPRSFHESLVSFPGTAPYHHQLVGDSVEASAHIQFASTLASPQQWESIRILCEVDNYTVLAWLTGLHSSPPGCPHWFQPRALSSQQFVALSALKQCPNGLILAWLYCARRIGKSMHWPVTTRSHR